MAYRKIPHTTDEKWLVEFTQKLSQALNIKVEVVFSQRGYSFHRKRQDIHLIAYGAGDIERCQKNFCEYKSWQHLWPGYAKMRGKWALWGLAIHEFAHAVQTEKGLRTRGSVHNLYWASIVRELQTKHTFIDNLIVE